MDVCTKPSVIVNIRASDPRHAYFNSREVTANPKFTMKLTMDDVRLLSELCGIDLSFVVSDDAQ